MCAPGFVEGSGEPGPRRRAAAPLAADLARARSVLDLTHPLRAGFPVFPGFAAPAAEAVVQHDPDGYFAQQWSLVEHAGTHVDAPGHVFGDGRRVDELDPAVLVAPLAVMRIGDRAARDPDASLTPADVEAWERRHGPVPEGALVAVDSGWASRAGDPSAFLGAGEDGAMHFPAISPSAAELLVRVRRVAGVGVDSLSLDAPANGALDTHKIVLGAGCYGVECLANLGAAPDSGAVAVVAPLPLAGGSGAPARVLALF